MFNTSIHWALIAIWMFTGPPSAEEAQGCPENSKRVKEWWEGGRRHVECECLPTYGLVDGKCLSCEAIASQAQTDRDAITQQIATNDLSQEELAGWKELNDKAQTEAVIAGAKFILKEFVSDLDPLRKSTRRLEHQAAGLAQKATRSRKSSTRLSYITRLNGALDRLEPIHGNLFDKEVVQAGLDAQRMWNLARNTMRHEFRVARKHSQEIQELLEDADFMEAFTGDDIDTPGLNVLTSLVEKAGEEAGKFLLGLEKYERFTGPTARAAVFVRDASYSALLSYFSTERAIQQSDLAGDLAIAAAVLQRRYRKSIDGLRACREAGPSK